jgi:hypothetical protein
MGVSRPSLGANGVSLMFKKLLVCVLLVMTQTQATESRSMEFVRQAGVLALRAGGYVAQTVASDLSLVPNVVPHRLIRQLMAASRRACYDAFTTWLTVKLIKADYIPHEIEIEIAGDRYCIKLCYKASWLRKIPKFDSKLFNKTIIAPLIEEPFFTYYPELLRRLTAPFIGGYSEIIPILAAVTFGAIHQKSTFAIRGTMALGCYLNHKYLSQNGIITIFPFIAHGFYNFLASTADVTHVRFDSVINLTKNQEIETSKAFIPIELLSDEEAFLKYREPYV